MEDGSSDSDAALHSHDTPEEQRTQAKEDHACTEDGAHDVLRVKLLPILVGTVDKQHQSTIDDVTQQVCDHQAAGKQQEGRLGLDPGTGVGLDEDKESKAVGEDANSHGDDRGDDRHFPLVAGIVAGSDLQLAPWLWAPIGWHGSNECEPERRCEINLDKHKWRETFPDSKYYYLFLLACLL